MVIQSVALKACLVHSQRLHKPAHMDLATVLHKGGCHCGSVRFEVRGNDVLNVIDCNCSICVKKQNKHFIVPSSHFKLIKGHDVLKTYSFGTHQAKHMFCIKCGVQSFYIPRTNPDGYGVAAHCLDEGTVKKVKYEKFNGKCWEDSVKKNPEILEKSKVKKGGSP